MSGEICLLLCVTGFNIERKRSGYFRVHHKRKQNFKVAKVFFFLLKASVIFSSMLWLELQNKTDIYSNLFSLENWARQFRGFEMSEMCKCFVRVNRNVLVILLNSLYFSIQKQLYVSVT